MDAYYLSDHLFDVVENSVSLTPEREQEIRKHFTAMVVKELLAEIDALRDQMKVGPWDTVANLHFCLEGKRRELDALTKSLEPTHMFSQMCKERDELKAENAKLKYKFKMAQASMPEVIKLRERIATLREYLQNIGRYCDHEDDLCECSTRMGLKADEALAQDDIYSKQSTITKGKAMPVEDDEMGKQG